MVHHFKVNFTAKLPNHPSEFKRVFFDRWVTHWEYAGQKWVTQQEIAYDGFGDRKLIYRAYNHLDLMVVFHGGRFYRLEDYGSGCYVRVDSEYQTLDQWHFVFVKLTKSLTSVWNKLKQRFKRRSKSDFPSLLPVAIQVSAKTIAFDMVAVEPMTLPMRSVFYLDYVAPGTQLELKFPVIPDKPRAIQLQLPFHYFDDWFGTGLTVTKN
jgi:hypothetical protein